MSYFLKSQGIVLKKKDFSENDRRYTILTEEYGKLEALAIGSHKIQSKLAGHLEPLTLGEFVFVQGHYSLRIVQAKASNFFPAIKQNLYLLSQAFFLIKLIDSFVLEKQNEPKLFTFLEFFLNSLEQNKKNRLGLEHLFALKLFQFLGYGLDLKCLYCRKFLENEAFYYPKQHVFSCSKCGHLVQKTPDQNIYLPQSFLLFLKKVLESSTTEILNFEISEKNFSLLKILTISTIYFYLEKNISFFNLEFYASHTH